MNTTTDSRLALRRWVLDNGKNLSDDMLTDTTPLFEARHLTSLNVPELLMKLEELRGRSLDLSRLRPGDFQNLFTIYTRFLAPDAS